jgi:hypothetical protein
LHGFVRGDTVGLLVLVHDTDTIGHVAQTLMAAASVRLAPAPQARLYHGGTELPAQQTVAAAGLTALERVDLVPEWPAAEHAVSAVSGVRVPEAEGGATEQRNTRGAR